MALAYPPAAIGSAVGAAVSEALGNSEPLRMSSAISVSRECRGSLRMCRDIWG